MEIILKILVSTLAVFVTAKIAPGVHMNSWQTALLVAVVLGFLNAFIRPILLIITLPINILTLGLLTFVIMGLMVYLTSAIVPGFVVDHFLWAILFALILALINTFFETLTR